MCSRNQFLLHLCYTTDEGNYKLWKIRHTERQPVVSLVKRFSNEFFQCLRSSPPASTRSLQLPLVFTHPQLLVPLALSLACSLFSTPPQLRRALVLLVLSLARSLFSLVPNYREP